MEALRRSQHPTDATTPVIDASVHIFGSRTRTCGRTSWREPFRAAGFPTTRWTGTARPAANTRKDRGPDRQYPGSDPEFVGRAAVRRARRRHRDPAPDDARHHARPPSRHRDRGRHNEMMVALAGGQHVRRPSAARSASTRRHHRALREIDEVQGPPGGRAARLSDAVARVYGKPQSGRCGRPPSRRTCRWRCTSRWARASLPSDPVGDTRTYAQYVSFMALNFLYHR